MKLPIILELHIREANEFNGGTLQCFTHDMAVIMARYCKGGKVTAWMLSSTAISSTRRRVGSFSGEAPLKFCLFLKLAAGVVFLSYVCS